ncbi:MAG TPA: hypothetical protein VLL97_03605 [Acidobacteriota bacterium]|nr:hypothetical protein [Acidobacteriota bacterium]
MFRCLDGGLNSRHSTTAAIRIPVKQKKMFPRFFHPLAAAGALSVFIALFATPAFSGVRTQIDDEKWFDIGARLQVWYQSVHEPDVPAVKDFMMRRAYVYIQGQVAPGLTFFTHIGGDRHGQAGLNNPGSGLGAGLSFRDGWIAYSPLDELKIQAGRMTVPFTRALGTESSFALLSVDMPMAQGGIRSGLFFPSNVGRNDGVTVWGNMAKGLFQYRAGLFTGHQGVENPERSLRTATRISINPLEKEGSWFNRGNYLGTKKILSIGAGFDRQADLQWTGRPMADYSAWTTDISFDHPVGKGAVNAQWAYTGIKNSQIFGDAKNWYLQGGILLPPVTGTFRIQPYARYESIDRKNNSDTKFAGGGVNLLFRGHDAKLTIQFDRAMPESGSPETAKSIFTVQMQVGI